MNKLVEEMLRKVVKDNPIANEAYTLATQGDWDGIIALYEREEPNWPKPSEPLACKKGCSLCCSLNVDIMDYEKDSLKKAIMALDKPFLQNVFFKAASKNQITKGLNPIEKGNKRYACSLLVDGLCSIYKDRPLGCKGFTSLDYSICVEGSVPDSNVQSKQWAQPEIHKQMVEMGASLAQLEYGGDIDDIATTLESFIDDELNK